MTGIAYAMGTGGAGGAGGGGGFSAFVPLILMFVIFYFLLIRPQQKKQKLHREMLENLKKGDRIITGGGIHGRITGLSDTTLTVEMASPVKDGDWLNCRVVPYGADQKLLLLRDVTERIRLSKMRRDFVANASHELRSPLTVIAGYLDSLADDAAIPP